MANECNQVILGSSYDKPSQASIQDEVNASDPFQRSESWKIGTSIDRA